MIAIRSTAAADAERLAQLQQEAFRPLYEKYHDAGNPCLRGTEDILLRLERDIFRYFTILEDGETVGGVLWKCAGRTPFVSELAEGEYYLQRVYVAPQRQSKHIARTAILLAEAQLSGAKRFYVDFPQDLEKNRRCYEAAGYRDTGMRLEAEPGLTLACYRKEVIANGKL